MFNHRHRYLFILLLSAYTMLNTVLCDVYYYFNIQVEWYYSLLAITLVTFFTWEGNRLLEPVLFRSVKPSKNNVRFIIAFFFIGLVICLLAAAAAVLLVGTIIHQHPWEQNQNPLKLMAIYGILINLLFHLVNTIFLLFREKEVYWKQAEELRKVNAQAEMQLVKNQVNPHFLFNNLNVLAAMVIKDNPGANTFIEKFSAVYRYILNTQEKEVVLLSTELDFIRSYLYLLEQRFPDGIHFYIDVPADYLGTYVVPAALQMLVENAIKHNIVSSQKPLTVSIRANGNRTIVVGNNYQPRSQGEQSGKIGLQNISRRYQLISGQSIEVRQTAESFEVELPLLSLN